MLSDADLASGKYDPATRVAISESKRIALARLAVRQQPADHRRDQVAALEERVARLEHLGDILGADAEYLVEGLGSVLPQFVHQETADLKARVATLEAELDALKARPPLSYKGVWKADHLAHYRKGDMATLDGAAWIATGIPSGRPGTADSGWTLAVKAAVPPRSR